MLEALKVIIFGIVEGITEWLPISSTGHLILLEELLHLKQNQAFLDMFYVVIQLGAILAVVVMYFHKLNPFSPKKTQKTEDVDDPVVGQSDHRFDSGNADRASVQ